MNGDRLSSPVAAAYNILQEYHNDVKGRLEAAELDEDIRDRIATDVFAKDDIYFSLNRSFKHIDSSFNEYCKGRLHDRLKVMFVDLNNLYVHQAEAIESILQEQTTIISTGTGSGKTESFMIPILHHCLVAKRTPGIKAVILYPLNALANDQLRRIEQAVKGTGIRIGCFVGSTPDEKERTSSDLYEICNSRKEMRESLPDILVTNYVMLDRLITLPENRAMFVDSAQTMKYIVVDEVHYYRGTKGANLSMLLRRLRSISKESVVQIGASGTLRQAGGYFPDSEEESIERFARLIFGNEAVKIKGFKLIEPSFGPLEEIGLLDPLPPTDVIEGDPTLIALNLDKAEELYQHLSGREVEKRAVRKSSFDFMYDFAKRSPYIYALRKRLEEGPCTSRDCVEEFIQLYKREYGKAPREPKKVVETYWSLINYLNQRCIEFVERNKSLILDFRLHIILGDVRGELTRCLLCRRYHDGRCTKCRHCGNGLLFKVSQEHPDLCIAYLADDKLHSDRPRGRFCLPVFVQIFTGEVQSTDTAFPPLGLEPEVDVKTGEESYRIYLAKDGEKGVTIRLVNDKRDLKALLLSEPRMYWQNILKVVDALVIGQKKRVTDKLLGFIDNRERASSIKLRLTDEIADRTLTLWTAMTLSNRGKVSLIEAFRVLEHAVPSFPDSEKEEEEEIHQKPLHEMPFWFTRMLSSIDEYEDWEITVESGLPVGADENELLEIMLHECAIDRASFWKNGTEGLEHFHLEKHRVSTQYGIGLRSTNERGYDIRSLGEQGRDYEEYINEGKMQQSGRAVLPLSDGEGEYRFGASLERDGILIRFADGILPPEMKTNFLAGILRGIPNSLNLDDSELRLAQRVQIYPQPESETFRVSNFFLYGHDKSGLVPVRRIFEYLENILKKTMDTLTTCSCGGSGCYLCLFSLNSRVLTGKISAGGAIESIAVFLRESLLKPNIASAKPEMTQPDIMIKLSVNGNQCKVAIQNAITKMRDEYVRHTPEEDYNARIYSALREVLESEWEKGARKVKMYTNIEHIYKQLHSENDVKSGQEMFLALRLALLKWDNWQIERG